MQVGNEFTNDELFNTNVFVFFMITCEGARQRAAVLRDRHPGAQRFMSAGSSHLGEDAWMGERPRVILHFIF